MEQIHKLESSQQQMLLMSILSSVSDGVIVADNNSEFIIMNPAARQITGITTTDTCKEHWSELFGCFKEDGVTAVPPEEIPLVQAMSGVSTDNILLVLNNKFLAEPKWISISGRPLEGFSMTGGVIIFRDVTQQKRFDDELARSHEELQQFAYVAAHDLQEPLRTITSYLSLLSSRYSGQLDTKGDKYINAAMSGAKRMQTLVNDLLTYSRIATKKAPLQPVPLGSIVKLALADLDSSLKEAGAEVQIKNLPTIKGDVLQLRQLMQNLLSNAVKYRAEGRNCIIELAATKRPVDWLISIKDNGIGFNNRYAQRIFLIFQRLHTRHKYEGTGIGLAICKRIVEQHGGKIWAESTEGQGTTFYFTIPILREEHE